EADLEFVETAPIVAAGGGNAGTCFAGRRRIAGRYAPEIVADATRFTSPAHHLKLKPERCSMRPMLSRGAAVHVDGLVTELCGDESGRPDTVDEGEQQDGVVAEGTEEVGVIALFVDAEFVALRGVGQQFVK